MVYHETQLDTLVSVDSLYTIHYFEYYRDYAFDGESHDFWEFLYIDKGEIAATCGGELIELHAVQAVLYRPLEFHALKANGVSAPNTIVISFASRSAALDSLAGRVIPITADARPVIGQILSEARMSFSTDLGDPCYTRLEMRPEMPIGSLQLIRMDIERLFIMMLRDSVSAEARPAPAELRGVNKQNEERAILLEAERYIDAHIDAEFRDFAWMIAKHESKSGSRVRGVDQKNSEGVGYWERSQSEVSWRRLDEQQLALHEIRG